MMKKAGIFLVLLFTAVQVYGQWNVKADTTLIKFTADDSTMGVGFFAGGAYDVKLAENFYSRPGLIYHYDRATSEISKGEHEWRFNMHYLKVPLNFSYHIRLNDNNYLNPYIGGYVYCGMFGSFKDKYG